MKAVVAVDAQTVFDPRELSALLGTIPSELVPNQFGLSPGGLKTLEAHRVFVDVSPINHVGVDTPPVYVGYHQDMVPITPDLDWVTRIPHPIFGQHLQRKMQSLGMKCVLAYDQPDEALWTAGRDFLACELFKGS